MTEKKKTVLNWSGGKDSAVALNRLIHDDAFSVELLLTAVNSSTNRVTMHGVRKELILRQSEALGFPVEFIELPENPSMEVYRDLFTSKMKELAERGFDVSAFGDIHLEDLRDYRDGLLEGTGLEAAYPIWHLDPMELTREFIRTGFKALLICVNLEVLDDSFAGTELNQDFLERLPEGVDPCGENGEYHSFVYDGPCFSQAVSFEKGRRHRESLPNPDQTKGQSEFIRFDYLDLI